MWDKTSQSLRLSLADCFMALILEYFLPLKLHQPFYISSLNSFSTHVSSSLMVCMETHVWLQQLPCPSGRVHTSSHARNGHRLPPLAKGFNPRRRCLNPAPCCHGNRSGKRVGHKGEVARGQCAHYRAPCDHGMFSIFAARPMSCGHTRTSQRIGNHFPKNINYCLKPFQFENAHLL